MHGMMRCIAAEEIKGLAKLSADESSVRFDSSELEQIIMNLAVNAHDATPYGVTLMIRSSTSIHQRQITPVPDGQWNRLAVKATNR